MKVEATAPTVAETAAASTGGAVGGGVAALRPLPLRTTGLPSALATAEAVASRAQVKDTRYRAPIAADTAADPAQPRYRRGRTRHEGWVRITRVRASGDEGGRAW